MVLAPSQMEAQEHRLRGALVARATRLDSVSSTRGIRRVGEQVDSRGGDAFLVRLHMRDVVLLMEEDLWRASLLGMHRPYGWAIPERYAVHSRRSGA
jgi:hypothetical protein